MDRGVIIGDIDTFLQLINNGMFYVNRPQCAMCLLDWQIQYAETMEYCAQFGITIVSLSEAEVEETLAIYQSYPTNRVSLAQYGAIVYAKNHILCLFSSLALIGNIAKELKIPYVQTLEFQEPCNADIFKLPAEAQLIPIGNQLPQAQTNTLIITQN